MNYNTENCRMFVFIISVVSLISQCYAIVEYRLSSNDQSYMSGVQGFATSIQCVLNTCLYDQSRVKWFHDGTQITDGINIVADMEKIELSHFVNFHPGSDCNGTATCSDSKNCPDGQHCLQNVCCFCVSEEYSLLVKNLTASDAGQYKCVLDGEKKDKSQILTFQMDIWESGLSQGFNDNITFNHSGCCAEQGMSEDCQPLCQPGEMETHKFDPLQCDSEIDKFLHCVTDGGNVSHVHCCRLQLVPPFCWQFCEGKLDKLSDAHKLCLYWLPEILECYEQAWLPYPGPPEEITVNADNSTSMKACWEPPSIRGDTVTLYTTHFREVPRFPFLGAEGSIPFLSSTGDHDSMSDVEPRKTSFIGGRRKREHERVERVVTEEEGMDADSTYIDHAEGWSVLRRKRQAWIFVTHNAVTNETRVKEFKFTEVNTTMPGDTCVTLTDMEPSTQYFIYVTATNDHGTSLPSVRAIATTPAIQYPPESMPDTEGCCRTNGVDELCIPKLCDLSVPPSAFGALHIAMNCRSEFSQVAPCLADQRDHVPCCKRKGVSGDCLSLCNGSAKSMGLSSVLCLTLDMHSVYSCLREGYVKLPSSPKNVTVARLSPTSASIKWSKPDSNHENVISYTLFLRKDSDVEEQGWTGIENVSSPHILENLDVDTMYMVYLLAHTQHGDSLPSTIEEFYTGLKPMSSVCKVGNPLRDPFGGRIYCGKGRPCPPHFDCIVSGAETDTYCCPNGRDPPVIGPVSPPDLQKCCKNKNVPGECLSLCSYNTTTEILLAKGPTCINHINAWLECGGDGRNHLPCCEDAGVSDVCIEFCRDPLPKTFHRGHLQCIKYAEHIQKCGREGVLKLPGIPLHLRVKNIEDKRLNVEWDPPSQLIPVKFYTLFVFKGESLKYVRNVTTTEAGVDDLDFAVEYKISVQSFNEHGSSVRSANVSVVMPITTGEEAERPSAPFSVEEIWANETAGNVTWKWNKKTNNNKDITDYMFSVHYRNILIADAHVDTIVNETQKMWAIMSLKPRMLYNVWVQVKNMKDMQISKPSEIINVHAVSKSDNIDDSMAVPEMYVTPNKPTYTLGDSVTITCNSSGNKPLPDIELDTGVEEPVMGKGSVMKTILLNEAMAHTPVICTAHTNNGNVFRSRLTIDVLFEPKVVASQTKMSAFEGNSVTMHCTITGNPTPIISWCYSKLPQKNGACRELSSSTKTLIEAKENNDGDSFDATITLLNVHSLSEGYYHCEATNHIGYKTAGTQLTVRPLPQPATAQKMSQCCEDAGVMAKCRSACKYVIDASIYENTTDCYRDFEKIVTCARQMYQVSHRDCCISKAIPNECLKMCDSEENLAGDSGDLKACYGFHKHILSCIAQDHRSIPSPPRNVQAVRQGTRLVLVSWKKPQTNADQVQTYAVSYKKKDDIDAVFKSVLTMEEHVVLENLDLNTEYEIHVAALTKSANSDFTSTSIIPSELNATDSGHRSNRKSVFGSIIIVLVCLLVAVLLIIGVFWCTKSRRTQGLTSIIGNKFGVGSSGNPCGVAEQTVAFENPGYDTEAHIRLPGDEMSHAMAHEMSEDMQNMTSSNAWNHADLEPAVIDHKSGQKGLKYTQLT